MKENEWKYYAERGLTAMAHVLTAGAVIQTFMMEQGISEQAVSNYTAILNVVQVLIMLLLSARMERVRNVVRYYGLTACAQILLLLVLTYFSLNGALAADIKYAVILVAGVATNIFYGINVILTYKLPYHVLDMHLYGKIMGKSGIISGTASMTFSAVLAWCIGRFEYSQVMTAFFLIGAALILLTTAIIFFYVPVKVEKEEKQEDKPSKSIFGYRVFHIFCIPDFLRGFGAGIFGVATVVGYHYDILNVQAAGVLPVIINAATIAGCFLYSRIVNDNNNRTIILVSSIMMLVFLPLMLVGKNVAFFCTAYVLVHFAVTLINYAVPVMVTEIVDYEYIGQYSAWRMLLYTAGTATAGFAVTYMLTSFGGIPTLIIAGLAQLASGMVYFMYKSRIKAAK